MINSCSSTPPPNEGKGNHTNVIKEPAPQANTGTDMST